MDDDSPWFEEIPLADFDDDKSTLITQIRETKSSSNIQFYQEVRSPRSVDDLLKHMRCNYLIWMNDESFIMFCGLPKSVLHGSKFRKAVMFSDFERKGIFVRGTSNEILARAAARILCLKDETANQVRIGYRFRRRIDPFVPNFVASRFLHKFSKAHPQRELFLESIALASHPGLLTLSFEWTHPDKNRIARHTFADGGRSFVETLARRTSEFGTLSLQMCSNNIVCEMYSSSFGRLPDYEATNALSKISLKTNSGVFEGSRCLVPLSLPTRRVEYIVYKDSGFEKIEPFTVVPKAVTFVFVGPLPSRFHSLFLQASGNLRELGLIYNIGFAPE